MSLAALIGIDKERYDQGNTFLSQDPYLQNFQSRAPITFNMSSPVNTGIMGSRMYPYPIIPQEGGDGGGGITFGPDKGVTADASATGGYNLNPDGSLFNDPEVEAEIAAARNKDRLSKAAQLGLFALNPAGYIVGKGIKGAYNFVKDRFFGGDGDSGSGGGGKGKGNTNVPSYTYEGSDEQDKDDEGHSNTTSSTSTASTAGDAPGYSGPSTFEYGGRVGFDNGLLADVTKTAEYKGWKKMYEMNPDIGKMHEQHNSFLKAYNTEQKAYGGIVGLYR